MIQGDCYGGKGSAVIKLTMNSGSEPMNIRAYTFQINKNGEYYGIAVSPSGMTPTTPVDVTLSNLAPGNYTISGSASGDIAGSGTSVTVSAAFSTLEIFVGYRVIWGDVKEMTVQSSPPRILQSIANPSQTYSGGRSINESSSSCWVMASAYFNPANSNTRSVFLSISNNSALVSFSPSSQSGYIEFRKGGTSTATSGEGVYAKFSGFTYKLTGITISDRIRVERLQNVMTGVGSVKFYKDQSSTALGATNVTTSANLSPLTVTHSSIVYHTAFANVLGDGLQDVASSASCGTSELSFADLKYELDGFYHVMKHGKVRFLFENEYDAQTGLVFNIYRDNGGLAKTQSNYPAIPVAAGPNYLTIETTPDAGCLSRGMYYLEVINDKKEKFYLRFYSDHDIICPSGQGPSGPVIGG